LRDYFEFEIPSGGMAFWLTLRNPYRWEEVAATAQTYKLDIGEWQRYDLNGVGHNAIRLGFATFDEKETEELFTKLRKTLEAQKILN